MSGREELKALFAYMHQERATLEKIYRSIDAVHGSGRAWSRIIDALDDGENLERLALVLEIAACGRQAERLEIEARKLRERQVGLRDDLEEHDSAKAEGKRE